MARRYRRSRRGGVKFGKWINLAGKVIGGTVMAYPAISAVTTYGFQNNDWGHVPVHILQNYTGWQADQGQFYPASLGTGVASVLGGFVIIKLFSWMSKRF